MKNFFLCGLALFLGYTASAQRPTSGQRLAKVLLTGKVLDRETQEPLEYATITLQNERRPDMLQGELPHRTVLFRLTFFRENILSL